MELIRQPPDSFQCGQCCVAMVTGLDRKASCKVFGTKGVTTTKSVGRALKKLGYVANERLKTFRKESSLPAVCLLRLTYVSRRYGHWVVYNNGQIYCPGLGIYPYSELGQRGEKCSTYLGFTAHEPNSAVAR